MTTDMNKGIVPADFPQLKQLVWNRNAARPIAAEEVFSLYERNWRFVDIARLTPPEAALIADLAQKFGKGRLLV